ncbi:unnamed protein product [Mytilus edulis]|uniref:Uncharacterized protein n=1 Tax=Mytilus edulis TaxID=6550 RepID=A0A8S3QDC5_MYTED|nr:unnamed protein product [Mytilus edulis]
MDGNCVGKCPDNRLIVGSSCKDIEKCPYHTYLEHSEIGKRCTNKCSVKFYLNGLDCIKECPPQKVIAGINCLDQCPSSSPLSHKDFSSKPRIHCYGTCPSDYVANGTECIESSQCQAENHFTYRKRCYEKCPLLTIEYGHLLYWIVFKKREDPVTFDQVQQAYKEDQESNTTPLISFENSEVESKQPEHLGSITARSDIEDIMTRENTQMSQMRQKMFRLKFCLHRNEFMNNL